MGPILVGRGQVISGRLANRFNWESIWNEHKIIGGVVGPISMPNGYLSTVYIYFDEVVSLLEAVETMPSHGPHRKSLKIVTLLLSPCM